MIALAIILAFCAGYLAASIDDDPPNNGDELFL